LTNNPAGVKRVLLKQTKEKKYVYALWGGTDSSLLGHNGNPIYRKHSIHYRY